MTKYNNCHYWNGTIYKEWWTTYDNIIYRENGPSIIHYDEDGDKEIEIWHNPKGEIHRISEPAIIGYKSNGKIDYREWWINNNRIK